MEEGPPSALPPIDAKAAASTPREFVVQGELAPSAGSKLREPLRDVPATINTVTARTLRERAETDLVGALGNVAGVNAVLQYGGFSYLTIRGFHDFVVVVDGVRDDRYFFVESAPTSNLSDIARIDVLKGPASALYGYGGIGGIVSMARKQPAPELTYEAGLTVGGPRRMRRAYAGVGGPIGSADLTYRLDAGLQDDVDFRGAQVENAKVSGVLEYRPSQRHRVALRAGYSHDRFNTDTGLPTDASGHVPDGIPTSRRFNTAQDYLASQVFEGSVTWAFQATDWLEVDYRASYSSNPYSYASAETLGLGPKSTVTRGWFFLERDWRPAFGALEVRATGKLVVLHRALAGYEVGLLSAQNPQADLSHSDLLPLPFAAGADPQGEYTVNRTSRIDWRQITHSLYLHDTLTLFAPLKLAVGGRVDAWTLDETRLRVDPGTLSVIANEGSTRRASVAPTWRAGLVYQPTGWVTLYASAATAFRPAREIPADGRQLRPEHGRQVELGVRGEAARRRLLVSVAVYDLAKTDVVVSRGQGVFDQAGQQSSRGVEIDAELKPLAGFSARAGYACTRARYDAYTSPDGSDYAGKVPPNVPAHTVTLWSTYRLENGLGLGLGGRAVTTSYADPANAVALPGYAIVDGAVSYRFDPVEIALNVNNVLGAERYFVSSINGTQLTPGQPRVVLASLRFQR